MMSSLNPIARLGLISRLKSQVNKKLSQIEGLLENLRCNIYITELVCCEISSQNNLLSQKDQENIAFDILNAIFSYNLCEMNAIKSQIEYLHSKDLIKPPKIDEEEEPKRFTLFRSKSSKKKLL